MPNLDPFYLYFNVPLLGAKDFKENDTVKLLFQEEKMLLHIIDVLL